MSNGYITSWTETVFELNQFYIVNYVKYVLKAQSNSSWSALLTLGTGINITTYSSFE